MNPMKMMNLPFDENACWTSWTSGYLVSKTDADALNHDGRVMGLVGARVHGADELACHELEKPRSREHEKNGSRGLRPDELMVAEEDF